MSSEEFYQPNLLFRNNAIRRRRLVKPGQNLESDSTKSSGSSSWLLNNYNPNDTEVLDRSCSLNRSNIKSCYWKIPDEKFNLSSLALTGSTAGKLRLAVSSANVESNLFIYNLDAVDNYLTHHSTITLPYIHSMKWLPQQQEEDSFLLTGNNKGYANLVSIPLDGETEKSAEIVKRFNHRKHLKSINKNPNISSHNTTNITHMDYYKPSSHLMTIYDNNFFIWDIIGTNTQIRPKPISIISIPGIENFDLHPKNINDIAICGKFGISLFDKRQSKINVPYSSRARKNKKLCETNLVRWSPNNEFVFASADADCVVRLWDIRKNDFVTSLSGHTGKVISAEWNKNDIFTGARDGNIVHWDLTSDISNDMVSIPCRLKEGLNSISFDAQKNKIRGSLNERYCGTVLPASNTNIIDMTSIRDPDNTQEEVCMLSIDSSSFLGLHYKIYEANDVKMQEASKYYTQRDIDLMVSIDQTGDSNETLVGLEVQKPSLLQEKSDAFTSTITSIPPDEIKEKTVSDIPESPSFKDFFQPPKSYFLQENTSVESIDSTSGMFSDSQRTLDSTLDFGSLETLANASEITKFVNPDYHLSKNSNLLDGFQFTEKSAYTTLPTIESQGLSNFIFQ